MEDDAICKNELDGERKVGSCTWSETGSYLPQVTALAIERLSLLRTLREDHDTFSRATVNYILEANRRENCTILLIKMGYWLYIRLVKMGYQLCIL